MAENDSNNIIRKGGITNVGTEMNRSKNEKMEDEAKEEGQVAEEDGITISHKSSRNNRPPTGSTDTTLNNCEPNQLRQLT